jgi:hypothetical protein
MLDLCWAEITVNPTSNRDALSAFLCVGWTAIKTYSPAE